VAPLTNYQRIWSEWLAREDYTADIQRHLESRQLLHKTLARLLDARGMYQSIGVRCLEIGCGTAIDSYIVADITNAVCYASDITEQACLTAKAMAEYFQREVYLGVVDASQMGFPGQAFDIVFSQGVLEHFGREMLHRVMAEQVRVLRPGGYLVIDVPQTYNWYTVKKHILIRRGQWPWGYETQFSVRQLRQLGEAHGLRWQHAAGYKTGYRYQKLRRLPIRLIDSPLADKVAVIRMLADYLDKLWHCVEEKYGQHFLGSVIATYRKPEFD
jgi:ubiquinone/menaquinone biosynthesis C-methylase UbiE